MLLFLPISVFIITLFQYPFNMTVQTTEEITQVSRAQPARVIKTTKKVDPPIKTEHPQAVYEKKKTIFRVYQIIWYILGLIEVLLAFRVGLKFLAAYPGGFTNMIYSLSDPLAIPFRGILSTPKTAGSILELSTLLAMLVYALIAYGVVKLLQFMKPVTPEEVEEKVDSKSI